MSYQVAVKRGDQYLHFVITGENSAASMLSALRDVRTKCIEDQCWKIILDDQLSGQPLDEVDIRRIVDEEGPNAAGLFVAIAYVDHRGERYLTSVGESAAVERNVPFMAFPSVEEAREWITQRPDDIIVIEDPGSGDAS